MLLDLRAIAFPDTQFRASFAQPLHRPTTGGVNLCGQQSPLPPHTRAAYIVGQPRPQRGRPRHPYRRGGFRPRYPENPLPVEVPAPGWKYLNRVREWTLVEQAKKIAKSPW